MFWFDTPTVAGAQQTLNGTSLDLSQISLSIGALGTAATGLVDTTKVFYGGLSRAGFSHIKTMMHEVYLAPKNPTGPGLPLEEVLATLRANWINGMKLPDQKSAAKSLIKLQFNKHTAKDYATLLHVKKDDLESVAKKMADAIAPPANVASESAASQPGMTAAQTDAFGRFDLALTARIDQAYQRADQLYRNTAKATAAVIAVGLAFAGDFMLAHPYHNTRHWWVPGLVGLIATPLAPVAKDLSTAIAAGAKALQSIRK